MKRLPKTLTAAVLTGALALGGTAVAQADEMPETLVVDGTPYKKKDAQGNYESINEFHQEELSKEQAEAIWKKQQANQDEQKPSTSEAPAADENKGDIPAPATKKDSEGNTWYQSTQDPNIYVQDKTKVNDPITPEIRDYYAKYFLGEDVKPGAGNEGNEQPGAGEETTNDGIPNPATKEDKEGNTWYQHIQDPNLYVKDRNDFNAEITDEMREAYAKAFPADADNDNAKDEKKFDAKKLAWLALPAALIIGGITWYLTHDGKTYVKDEARKNEQPTAEEKAASEQMLKENKDEVIAQGGKLAEGNSAQGTTNGAQSTDNVRGMAAETGSNSIARGAVALAIAGLLAAGAFVARRKFFA